MTARPTTRTQKFAAPRLAVGTCLTVATASLVGARFIPDVEGPNRAVPLIIFGLLWAVAAYRLWVGGRAGLARGISIFALGIGIISALASLIWLAPWSNSGGTLDLSRAGFLQLVVPVIGGVVVLVALRPSTHFTPTLSG